MADYSKFEVLEHIFDEKTLNKTQHIGTDTDFTLRDVGNAMMRLVELYRLPDQILSWI